MTVQKPDSRGRWVRHSRTFFTGSMSWKKPSEKSPSSLCILYFPSFLFSRIILFRFFSLSVTHQNSKYSHTTKCECGYAVVIPQMSCWDKLCFIDETSTNFATKEQFWFWITMRFLKKSTYLSEAWNHRNDWLLMLPRGRRCVSRKGSIYAFSPWSVSSNCSSIQKSFWKGQGFYERIDDSSRHVFLIEK